MEFCVAMPHSHYIAKGQEVKNHFQVLDQEESTAGCFQHFAEADTEAMNRGGIPCH